MDVSYIKPMDYGMGIDSLTMRPRNPNAVTVPGLKEVQGSGDTQTAEFSLVNAESIEDFESAFSFSADASADNVNACSFVPIQLPLFHFKLCVVFPLMARNGHAESILAMSVVG
jgi:hypothetical protein